MQTNCMNHGAASCVYTEGCNGVSQSALQRFAELVRADERERCAKVAELWPLSDEWITEATCAELIAAAIRNSASRGAEGEKT